MSEPLSLVCSGCRLGESACTCSAFGSGYWNATPPWCRCGRPLVKEPMCNSVTAELFACNVCHADLRDEAAADAHERQVGHSVSRIVRTTGGATLAQPMEGAPVLMPVRVEVPTICAACDRGMDCTEAGPLRWRRLQLTSPQLRAHVVVPLHTGCVGAAGVSEVVTRLVVGLASEAIKVAVVPLAGELKGGNHG